MASSKPQEVVVSSPSEANPSLEAVKVETVELRSTTGSIRRRSGYAGVGRAMDLVFGFDDNMIDEVSFTEGAKTMGFDVVFLLLIVGLGAVAMIAPKIVFESGDWLVDDVLLREAAMSHLLMIIPAVIALLWCCMHVTRGVSAFGQNSPGCIRLGRLIWLTIAFSIIVAIVQCRKATVVLFPEKRRVVDEYLWTLLGLVTVIAVCLLLELVHSVIDSIAKARSKSLQAAKPVAKWRGLMENFCRWRKPEADAVYTFANASSALEVLSNVVWIYFSVFKCTAFLIYFLFYTGFDVTQPVVWVLIAGLLGSASLTLSLSPALRNLVPLAFENPFYIGEIISLTTPGGLPPDNPTKSLTGFVEAVTLTHVVMRDFRRKQTWITHENFTKYNLSNWTRRPCRLVHINFTVSSRVEDAAKVAQLSAFSKKWMDSSSKVDTSSYRKSVLVDAKNGMKLEVIFYPLPGIDSYPLRQAFIVALVSAAKRLGLPVVPNEMLTSFPTNEGQQGNADTVEEAELEDLLAQE